MYSDVTIQQVSQKHCNRGKHEFHHMHHTLVIPSCPEVKDTYRNHSWIFHIRHTNPKTGVKHYGYANTNNHANSRTKFSSKILVKWVNNIT